MGTALYLSSLAPASAQFIRLGPFGITLKGRVEGVYTTNVEQERPEDAEGEMEDYYGVIGFDANGQARMMPRTTLNLDTGMSIEEHVNRPDLNNTSDPFGRIRLNTLTQFKRTTINADVSYEHLSESKDDEFAPGRKKRDPRTEFSYGGEIKWAIRVFEMGGAYSFNRERHEDDAYRPDDQDDTTVNFLANLMPSKYFGIRYTYEWKKTEFVNQPENDDDWETTENISMDVPIRILERPQLTYSFGLERERTEEDDGKWEPVHNINLSDGYDVLHSKNLKLTLNASYTYKREEETEAEKDDVTFTYGAILEHQISRTAVQRFSAQQEPVDTFGTRNETESTTFAYGFSKDDLFIYNLNLSGGIQWERSKPLGEGAGETEKKWNYDVSLTYRRTLTRKLERTLEYKYTREDSNLEDEPLIEHRVTLNYVYTF
jgi:hypothetical protein